MQAGSFRPLSAVPTTCIDLPRFSANVSSSLTGGFLVKYFRRLSEFTVVVRRLPGVFYETRSQKLNMPPVSQDQSEEDLVVLQRSAACLWMDSARARGRRVRPKELVDLTLRYRRQGHGATHGRAPGA